MTFPSQKEITATTQLFTQRSRSQNAQQISRVQVDSKYAANRFLDVLRSMTMIQNDDDDTHNDTRDTTNNNAEIHAHGQINSSCWVTIRER